MQDRPGDILELVEHDDFSLAVPTPDHFIPLLHIAALAADSGEQPDVLVDGYSYGSLSMTSYTSASTALTSTTTVRPPSCQAQMSHPPTRPTPELCVARTPAHPSTPVITPSGPEPSERSTLGTWRTDVAPEPPRQRRQRRVSSRRRATTERPWLRRRAWPGWHTARCPA